MRIGPQAPTIRSAKPSPLTSPAEATELPLRSPAATPLSLKPLAPLRVERSRLAPKPAALPNTT